MDWKDNFERQILVRGEDYYKSGAVEDLKKTKDGYEAQVEGNEIYQVEIYLSDDTVKDMYCSCPYAENGENCKHMAAVLYKIENQIKQNNYPKETDIKSLLDELTKEQLSEFILELTEEDIKIGNKLLIGYSNSINSADMRMLKREVDAVVEKYTYRSGYIVYYHVLDFLEEMEYFLDECASTLVDRKFNLQAFELSSYIFLTLANMEIEDSDDEISQFVDTCCELWKTIIQNSNDDEKEQIHTWLLSEKSDSRYSDYFQDCMDGFLINELCDAKLIKKRINQIDNILQKSESGGEEDEKIWDYGNGFCHPVIVRLNLMKKLGYPEDEIREYCKKYRMVPEIRRQEILEYIDKGQWNQAISTLLESKETDKENNSLVSWYSEKLIELYEKQNMQNEYKNELLFYITYSYQGSLGYVYKLKNSCSLDEWIAYREKILEHKPALMLRYKLMKEEKMYDRLIHELMKSGDIYIADLYESLLKDKYPKEMIGIYRDYLMQEAQTPHSRSTYRKMISYLKKISGYPGGAEIAHQIASQWQKTYRRRYAMIDELKKAGF